ncbi:hypothetical protein GPROT1_04016 [Gammaproteobacteria bacterium]|nr:hypothetical protein GPROT1_04016 [Gammaproteobacteria bacterium]
MRHPLEAIPPDRRARVFIPLLIATLLITFAFRFIGPAAPTIVDFELAGTVGKATDIITTWTPMERIHAGFSLGFDYLYMPIYSTTIALACVWAATIIRSGVWKSIGRALAWGLWLAAIFDAIENLALIGNLFGSPIDPLPALAAMCAALKFGLILSGLLYVILAVVQRLRR